MTNLVDIYHWSDYNKNKCFTKNKFLVSLIPVMTVTNRHFINDKYAIFAMLGAVYIYNSNFDLIDDKTFPVDSGFSISGLYDDNLYLINFNDLGCTFKYNVNSKILVKLNQFYRGALFLNEGILVPSFGRIQLFSYDDVLIWQYLLNDENDLPTNIRYEEAEIFFTRNEGRNKCGLNVKNGSIIYDINVNDLLDVNANEISSTISFIVDNIHIAWQLCTNTIINSDVVTAMNSGFNRFFGLDIQNQKLKWDITIPYFYAYSVYDKCYFNIYIDMNNKRIKYLVMNLISGKVLVNEDIDNQIKEIQVEHEKFVSFKQNYNIGASCVSEEFFYFGCGSLYLAMNRNDYSITLVHKLSHPIGFYSARIVNSFIMLETGNNMFLLKTILNDTF